MTLQDFKQLLPRPAQPEAQAAAAEHAQQAERRSSGAGASCSGAQLARCFNTEEGEPTKVARPWRIVDDDELPTLAEVFEASPPCQADTMPSGTLRSAGPGLACCGAQGVPVEVRGWCCNSPLQAPDSAMG